LVTIDGQYPVSLENKVHKFYKKSYLKYYGFREVLFASAAWGRTRYTGVGSSDFASLGPRLRETLQSCTPRAHTVMLSSPVVHSGEEVPGIPNVEILPLDSGVKVAVRVVNGCFLLYI
jgi:hypothetical protein